MMQKVIRMGTHSLAVIIPADFVHAIGVKSGDEVRVVTDRNKGRMIVNFSNIMQLSLSSVFSRPKKK